MAKEFKVPVGVPRLTTTEMNALANPQKGWQVYDITTDDPKYYNGSAWVVSGAGGGGGHVIQEEGSPLTQRAKLNFIGDAVEATDDAGNDATKVTIDSVAHYREFYVAGTGKDNYTGSLTVIDTLASYVNNGKRLRVLINGQVLTPVTHYVETSATKVTLNDALDADDDIQLEWLDSAVGLTTPTPGTHRQEDYVAGTPLDNYTGSLTVIDLVNIYAQDGKTLRVAVNGSVQTVTLGYNETGPSQITFTSPLTTGTDKVSIWWVSDATNAVSYTPATQVNEDFVATAGQTDFPLANSTSGYLPLVFVDGIIQRSGYSYPSPTLLRFDDGLDLGQPVLVWFIKQTGNMGYMQEQIYEVEATADQKVFNIPWVFAVGYASLLVFHEGVKMSGGGDASKNDYFESSNKQITFYDGRGLDEKVAFYAKNRLATGDADTVDGIHASATPIANKLLALDGSGKLPLIGPQSLTANGYTHANGLIIQWGKRTAGSGGGANPTITYPVAFTTVFSVICTGEDTAVNGAMITIDAPGASSFVAHIRRHDASPIDTTMYWVAVGI